MKPFETFRGILAPLDRANVDTDQIIPKQFLKSIARTGFGESLFYDWRYLPDGKPNPEFSINGAAFAGASVLVTRNNFGCGSSREHAVWAIQQYGFRVILASWADRGQSRIPAFADIFRNNCAKNGVLTVELGPSEIDVFFQAIREKPGVEATVDLANQKILLHGHREDFFSFDVDGAVKNRLLRGLDDIGVTLQYEEAIRAFEARHHPQKYR